MRILNTRYNPGSYNTALLILRLGFGILIAQHGYDKFVHFSMYQSKFINFMGLGNNISLGLVVFAELFCGILVALGLLTRLACIPLIITMAVALFKAHGGDFFGVGQAATLYLIVFFALLLTGPGKMSVDSMISK